MTLTTSPIQDSTCPVYRKMVQCDTTTVAGIQLPYVGKDEAQLQDNATFIYEEGTSSYENLQQLALAVSCHRPVLLQGPVGSGKTSTVEYLAYITGRKGLNHGNADGQDDSSNKFLKVQLGEQTDSRMLIGGYQCTEIPGQFVWKPGVLTQAVLQGHWLLLEDIDCTSSDVVTVIDNLIKTQSLCVSGFSDNIIPHPEFQLFATQRTLRYESVSGVKQNILKNWFIINLQTLTNTEITGIITKKYPKLNSVANRMVSILDLECFSVQSNHRIPSVRDVIKWCNRCHVYFEVGSPESALKIFHDAVDVFCGHMDKKSRLFVAEQIGVKLGIVKNKANFLISSYKPDVVVTDAKLIAGRSCLDRKEDKTVALHRNKRQTFSLTAPSCSLIEKVACCLENNEPVLLVGETGCGKTTVLQYMADILGRTLIVINMNQQSDTTDLIGGFKPVTFKWIMKPICDEFETLFRTSFDTEKNADCLCKFATLVSKQNWDVIIKFIIHVQKRALLHIQKKLSCYDDTEEEEVPKKRSKIDEKDWNEKQEKWMQRLKDWERLGVSVAKLSAQRQATERSLVFSFIEGSLVKAVKKGYWVLLDEINLATSETLDCLSGLLESSKGSLALLEKGESKMIERDSGFRLFAAMNPATDVGKKQLPVGLRNRFTEFFIDELDDEVDLLPIVETYLRELNLTPAKLNKIVHFYLKARNNTKYCILDGNGKKPHYSLRNLCRALMVASKNSCGNIARSLYEGLSLSFLTQLDSKSHKIVLDMIINTVTTGNVKALLNQAIPKPSGDGYINLEGFWIAKGSLQPTTLENYILTPTVQRHLRDLIRVVSLGNGIPVLLEGDTSVGKTSLITYLAARTGNFCARVNNHEHTDIQEYIGTYVADANGKLVFKEGILCEAMRKGYWLILDELNLAPTEVLEALNRVLDDNRELFVPETQVTIKAHEKFLLFATQNPPGMYGGRKELSRAFRNRFVEIQFNQIPSDELVTILEKRCQMPPTYCKKMVAVMTELQLRRRGSEIFIGKAGFITLRDLFRWGERYQKTKINAKFHDWEQHLADEGYILLAGRVRVQEESKVIQEVISKHFKRKTNPENLFSLHENTSPVSKNILDTILNFSSKDDSFKHVVWTYSMRRLAVLVCKALEFSEPVLLVGETGCGKTTVVQILSSLFKQDLYSVNCHMHSESADFLGGLRPVREESRAQGKLFEWCDGPLVQAMLTGSVFLADEISLADDSVLERLNSLLEPERTILLTEKGGDLREGDVNEFVTVAAKNFQFIGTMNPGGDYGKKELSPALRNRFTEIWVETNDNKYDDYQKIIEHNLINVPENIKSNMAEIMIKFLKWFKSTDFGRKITISVRDILTWVIFMNSVNLSSAKACIHGCFLTFLDGLGSGTDFIGDIEVLKNFRRNCVKFLIEEMGEIITAGDNLDLEEFLHGGGNFIVNHRVVGLEPFFISKGKENINVEDFIFSAPTTCSNVLKLLRGLQMNKAILLEGSPGVGKTSLVSSLAKASGFKLTRINLSDQTDISDLFGADLPEEGASAGHFVWRDGPFLTALKEGHWILLDELNLASQSVLEGLNAVLDHRGAAYIPELDKTFYISKQTRLFGCQNPLKEGGNRRGLPKSFLNRFTQVFVDVLSIDDYKIILSNLFPTLAPLKIREQSIIDKIIIFNSELCKAVAAGKVGVVGGPWELNLRDLTRWAEGIVDHLKLKRTGLIISKNKDEADFSVTEEILLQAVFKFMNLLYFNRFRTVRDRDTVRDIFTSIFNGNEFFNNKPQVYVGKNYVVIGENIVKINDSLFHGDLNEFEMFASFDNSHNANNRPDRREILKLCASYRGKRKMEELRLLEKQYDVLSYLGQCVNMKWLTILVGESGTGKTCCVRTFAALTGHNLRIMSNNSAMDTTEILGGFEQTDYNRHLDAISESAKGVVLSAARHYFLEGDGKKTIHLLTKWLKFTELPVDGGSEDPGKVYESFLARLNYLQDLLCEKDLRKNERFCDMSQELLERLEGLQKVLTSEDRLTCGGKFEWVDSILVKCLKDGSWLLMEDVNLCSNAVLDRLNCLLEPNGVLTIGERGATADGSLVTVKPHPDFRLFFTMDPKNGAISRAMRNRGVEIYLMPDENNPWPRLDLLTLLSDSGVKDCNTQTALIFLQSHFKTPNISNLVANGFWSSQYIRHGFTKSEAFRKSVKQIYKLEAVEREHLIADISLKLTSDRGFDLSFLRPKLNSYLIDPEFARLKQSCACLITLIDILKKDFFEFMNLSDDEKFKKGKKFSVMHHANKSIPLDVWEYFLGVLTDTDLLFSEALKFSLLSIYFTINPHTAEIARELILRNLEELKVLEGWENTSKDLIKLLEKFSKIVLNIKDSNDLPWDVRWYRDVAQLCNVDFSNNANKVLVLLKYEFLRNFESAPSLANTKDITVAEYSRSVKEGYLEDNFPEQLIISKFNDFLQGFDDLVETFLKWNEMRLNETDAKWFLNSMKWRFRLGAQGNCVLLSGVKRKVVDEDTLTRLNLHLAWFNKSVLSGTIKILPSCDKFSKTLFEKYSNFHKLLESVMISQNSSKLYKISNVFRRSMGQPLPNKYSQIDDAMEVEDVLNKITGDSSILQNVLISLLGFYHHHIISDISNAQQILDKNSKFCLENYSVVLKLLPKNDSIIQTLLQQYFSADFKERFKLSSELMFHLMRSINSDFDFFDANDEESKTKYYDQILPEYRPVWTFRTLKIVFKENESWNLLNFQNFSSTISDLNLTILSNAAEPINSITKNYLIDSKMNDRMKLRHEATRILNILKDVLDFDRNISLMDCLKIKLERADVRVEKIFYEELSKIVNVLLETLEKDENVQTGITWTLLGLLEILILQKGLIDPIRKKLIKADYALKEIKVLESEINTLELNGKVTDSNQQHFYIANLKEQLKLAEKNVVKYSTLGQIERNPKLFQELNSDIDNFITQFGERLLKLCVNVSDVDSKISKTQIYQTTRIIIIANKKFSDKLEKEFVKCFGDITYPVLASSVKIENGLNIIASELLRQENSISPYDANKLVVNLCKYPFSMENDANYTFKSLTNLLHSPDLSKIKHYANLLLLFSSCLIKYNEWVTCRNDSKYYELMRIFSLVVEFWKKQEEKRKEEEMEKESLYGRRGVKKCENLPEEEEFLQEQSRLFPTYEGDFEDENEKPDEKVDVGLLTNEHFSQISKLHMRIVKDCARFKWFPQKTGRLAEDFVTPLHMRFALLSSIVPELTVALDSSIDKELLNSLLVLIHSKQTGSCSTDAKLVIDDNKIYDFYKDKNVSEVSKCLDLLQLFKARIQELLEEWPENPVLVKMTGIIDRVLSFSIDSPVMRFLTGLELLLQEAQHWESNAHAGVSIATHLVNLTSLITDWRKLELQGWKNCLETAHERVKSEASKWWFHFWCLVEEYLSDEVSESKPSFDDLLKALYNFIETSPIGEFETRLDIVLSYHCHVVRLESSKKRDVLAVALWNLYSFYQQYVNDVNKKLKEMSAPVFSKLKDFVKIAKWHDITYWSLSQAIHKSHRTLLKYIKEYEVILKKPVKLITFDPNLNVGAKEKTRAAQNIMKYLSKVEKGDILKDLGVDDFGLPNLNKKFDKAQRFSSDIILSAEYPNLLVRLEELSEDIISNTEHFKNLEVDKNLPKEKQKSQAKNIVQQKRRAVADLFKTLQKIGLSYRAGLTDEVFGVFQICEEPPLNFTRAASLKMSGEEYHLKSMARTLMLENALLTPSKELGPQIIERLKGFAVNFMDLNRKQKLTLCKNEAALENLKKFEAILTSLKDDENWIPDQKLLRDTSCRLKEIINEVYYFVKQFSHILESWPTTGGDVMKEINFKAGGLTPQIMISTKGDSVFVDTRQKFDEISNRLTKLKNSFDKNFDSDSDFKIRINKKCGEIEKENFFMFLSKHENLLKDCLDELEKIVGDLKDIKNIFENDNVFNPVTEAFSGLEKYSKIELGTNPEILSIDDKINENLRKGIESAVTNILISIQTILKKYLPGEKTETQEDDTENVENEDLLDNHMKNKLVENLETDLNDLNMNLINKNLLSIFNCLKIISGAKISEVEKENYLKCLNVALPFVQQYKLLCSYFVDQQKFCYRSCNKLASILFGTFIQLAQKGFCIPPEYDEEEGEGGDGKGKSGLGLGDGEGTKDVSDRIDNEDQLEDARPEGEEREKEPDKDIDEEEKGIEMSDNFEGKGQDLKDKEDDEEGESEEEEEPDDVEMGETETGADKLDKELWGSDAEEEEPEEEDKQKQDRGKGEEVSRDTYGAKDDEEETGDNENDPQGNERKEKQKEINEEQEDNGDHVDPYHGHHEPEPEIEPFDLPDDLNLDGGEKPDQDENGDENPFDIDAMKQPPPLDEKNEDGDEDESKNKEEGEEEVDSSDEDDDKKEEKEDVEGEMEAAEEEGNENDEGKEEEEGGNDKSGKKEKDEDEEEKEDDQKNEDVPQEEFKPSDDKPSEMPAQPAPNEDEAGSKDQVVAMNELKDTEYKPQEVTEKSEKETKGTGQAELEDMSKGHDATTSKKEKLQASQTNIERQKKRERPGKSDEDRTLGDTSKHVEKKLKTLDEVEEGEDNGEDEKMEEADLYQHIKQSKEHAPQVLDAATKEQAETQPVPNKEDEEGEEPINEDVDMADEEEEDVPDEIEKQKPSATKSADGANKNLEENEGDGTGEEAKKEVEGDVAQTMTVERGPDTTFHTQTSAVIESVPPIHTEDIHMLRLQIQEQLSTLHHGNVITAESAQAWHLLNSAVDGLSRDLSEQLRLVLEPTMATRLKGDYRTGRRINMKKVISYIASEFRKDRIWLRRTKPWKREHEIVLAIDDSSSMSDNNSKELAFESLAMVSRALNLLEAGQLGVLSFGEKTKIVHRLGDPFTDETGARLLQEFTFEQTKTLISEMLEVSSTMLSIGRKKQDVSQLLIIISDGRGVFSEGLEKVRIAVRRATDLGIFLVFVIIDNPKSKDSIMDIRMPEFKDGKFLGIRSYMEQFPFPYYLILRDINALPNTLSDALRQWFQLISSSSSSL